MATARRMAARHQRARPSLPVESGTAACPHASESRARPPLRDRPVGAARDPRDAGRPRGRRADADRPRCRPYRGRGLRLAGRTRRRDRPCRHLDRHRDRPWPDRAGHRADQRARRSGVARPVAAGQPLECVRNRTRRDARFTGAARGAFREVDTPHAGRWRLLDIPLSGLACAATVAARRMDRIHAVGWRGERKDWLADRDRHLRAAKGRGEAASVAAG